MKVKSLNESKIILKDLPVTGVNGEGAKILFSILIKSWLKDEKARLAL